MFFLFSRFSNIICANTQKTLINQQVTGRAGTPPVRPKPLCSKAYSPTTADQVIIIIPQNITIIVSIKSMPTSLQF